MAGKTVIAICVLSLLSLSVAGAKEAPEEIKVVAEGYSYLGDDASIKEARAKAMAEAERAALEQGVPIYLDSYTRVRNYQVDTDEIRSRMKGIIKNKKVLLDELDKNDLKYKVKIEAVVTYTAQQQKAVQEANKADNADKVEKTKEEKVQEIRMIGNRRVDEPELAYTPPLNNIMDEHAKESEPIYRSVPENDFKTIHLGPCRFTPQRLGSLWYKVERVRKKHPRRFIRLVAMLYPNIQHERVVKYLFTIRKHNPDKFERIIAFIFPEIGRIPQLGRRAIRNKINGRLKDILESDPHRFIEFMRLALPKFNPPEFKSRLRYICRDRPQLLKRIEDILQG